MPQPAHIAVDLGAESGRVVVGTLVDGKLAMHETHRFRHLPVPTPAGLCWDLTGLWREILDGLALAAQHLAARGAEAVSVGVDTWAVDWTLLNAESTLLGPPRCYRDPVFADAFARVTDAVPGREIYEATGIQLMPFNTLYQYESRAAAEPAAFAAGGRVLFVPDLFHWLLSGKAVVERTNASTSQMVDVRTGDWNRELLERLGLPVAPLTEPVDAGTPVGTLLPAVAAETGLSPSVRVVLPPSHDTASAIAAVPADPETDWCYLSSGTWSLLGAELDTPCITDAAAQANFTNELGVGGTVRFLKNIAGLWLVQEVRRQLERDGQPMDYPELTRLAAEAQPFRTLIPVNDPDFARPGGMPDRIRAYARQTAQPVPETPGCLVRCCLESLALEYRRTLNDLERVLGRRFGVLHLVGGGGKNRLLNNMTAAAIGRPVVVGPDEGTAMGNLLTQAMGTGHVADLVELRRVVRASTAIENVDPVDPDAWSSPSARYDDLPPVRDVG